MTTHAPRLVVGLLAGMGWAVAGCASPAAMTDGGTVGPGHDGDPGHVPGSPGLGAHSMSFYPLDHRSDLSISTSPMTTQTLGSTIVVGVGRGKNALFELPTDNKGNSPYRQLDTMHIYTHWPDSGTAVYTFPSAHGGTSHTITTTTMDDEITLAAVEIIEGTRIQTFEWNEVVQPGPNSPPLPLTSASVVTTGAATLIAFWWGDGYPDTTPQTATPDNGFNVIETNVDTLHGFVQCAVAVKNVSRAGTYNVTWTATPLQGAQLWLIAVQ
jgi:hypothetical protein